MKRLVASNELNSLTINNGYELVKSYNEENCVTKETKIIIVGTITPPKANGYFYTSPYNCIYGYIDAVRGTNLKELKRLLKKDYTKKQEIIDVLKNQGIAFLDIMKEVIRKQGSSADDDIQNFSLDYEMFEKVFTEIIKSNKVKIICNSRLAEMGYDTIKNALKDKIILPKEIYVSQVRRLQKTEKEKWLKELQ